MKVEEPDLGGTYTYADYMDWCWEERVELTKGKIYKMSPAPQCSDQRVSGELHLQIGSDLKKKFIRTDKLSPYILPNLVIDFNGVFPQEDSMICRTIHNFCI